MTDLERLRRLVADYRVAEAYGTERERQPFDMTYGRRERSLRQSYREIISLSRALGLGDELDVMNANLDITHDEVVQAFDRICRRMLRDYVSRAVVDSLEAARVALSDELGEGLDDTDVAEIDRPSLLWDYVDGTRESYGAGGSRAARR